MVLVGAAVAVVTGIAYNAGAALQKREAVQVETGAKNLLGTLAKRKAWVAATALSTVAWIGQVVALALAPVALVVPLLSIGSAVLVVAGVRWLHERFHASELAGVALVVIGAATAGASESGSSVSRAGVPFAWQFAVAGIAIVSAAIVLRWRTGSSYGAAAGLGFAAVAIYSKELGDRLADHGLRALPRLLASPTPWLLLAISIGALSLLQAGFQRANAASVMAALTVPEAIGPLIAGFALYHEPYPHGARAFVLPLGLACAIAGSAMLALHGRRFGEPTEPATA